MYRNIDIITEKYRFKAELNDTKTSQRLLEMLPIKSSVNRWGNEIYFSIPLKAELEDGKEILNKGDIAFWPPGSAFCIFFGKTPASDNDKPRAASPVTVLGKIIDKKNLADLKKIGSGEKINIRLSE